MAKRKKRIKKSAVIISIILILGLFTIVGFGIKKFTTNDNNYSQENKNNENKDNRQNNNNKQNEDKEKTYKISLLATGDGLVHKQVFKSYRQDNGTYDFTNALTDVKGIVSKYDIAYYNQEPPMGDNSIKYDGYPRFYVPSEFGDAMIAAGFNTVSLATNHSLDVGEKGILNTLKYFKSTDMLYNGMSESEEDRNNYIIKEKNNITYSLLSYTTLTNGLSVPSGKSYLLNTYNKEKVKKDVEALRDKVDVLIVAMHWGVEYIHQPNAEEKEIAQYLADLGVDIVIGNHSHTLQPITWIDDTVVMYSLGNFISNQHGTDDWNKLVGFMATLDITKTVKDDKSSIKIDNLGGELIFTWYGGNALSKSDAAILSRNNHKVVPFSKMKDETYLKDYKRIYEKYSNILTSLGTNLNIAPLGA